MLGGWGTSTNHEIKERKKEFLLKWGYGDALAPNSYPKPFAVDPVGVMTQGSFITRTQRKSEGTIFQPEPLFSAATFGLAALDIITTTGARINEVLQIRNTKDCFIVKNITDGDKQITRYLFRAIPKGRTEPENFYLSDESVKVIREVRNLLINHYIDGKIPNVKYGGLRGQLIDKESPYLFQYSHTGLNRQDLTACMRFLLHVMIFEDQENNPIIIKPHLLRHAFANHLQYAPKMPIDLIASILHQKDFNTTEYYAEATDSQVALKTHELHQIMATYIEINSTVLREPNELLQALEKAKKNIGVYTQTVGGLCSVDAVCPVKMACVGCGGKVPTPEKKHELIVYRNWAEQSLKLWEEQHQPLEAQKMKAAIRAADKELLEIELIEKYKKDELYEPKLRIQE
ncbi:site-specific integrase [Brevibacillus sp. NPDC003359]|uniref:site-specific integrase n=1 Tax=unclassified Brevibacillus TaxID=2684853 RepID=UPI00368B28CA